MGVDYGFVYGMSFLLATISLLPLLAFLYITRMLFYRNYVSCAGLQTKALISHKHGGGNGNYFHIEYCALYKNKNEPHYSKHECELEIIDQCKGDYFHEKYDENDIIDIKYLTSFCSKTHYHHSLTDSLNDTCSSIMNHLIQMPGWLVVTGIVGIIYWPSYLMDKVTFLGIVFTFLNQCMLMTFFRYLCCPFTEAVWSKNWEEYKMNPFWAKPEYEHTVEDITKEEYDEFLLTLNEGNRQNICIETDTATHIGKGEDI